MINGQSLLFDKQHCFQEERRGVTLRVFLLWHFLNFFIHQISLKLWLHFSQVYIDRWYNFL